MTPEDRARHLAAEDNRNWIRKLSQHEKEVRLRERERAYRRMLPLLNTDSRPSDDFLGAVE